MTGGDQPGLDVPKKRGLVRAGEILKKIPALEQLASEAFAQEQEEAKEAGALGFMARALVQATMPHSKPTESFFERTNGAFTLTMMAPPKVGLPYGTIPRLLMAWLTTEAVCWHSRDLILGDSLSDFMRQLGMVPTGGRWGTITRLREQTRRLFTCSVSCLYEDQQRQAGIGFTVTDSHILWWDPKSPEQADLFDSMVRLSERFYEEIIRRPVPIDLRALRSLSKSPLSIDIYVWLTYRMSYLRRETMIPWPALQLQFGANYHLTRQFKAAFLEHLRKVIREYPEAKVEALDLGLRLLPSPTHVPRIGQ